MRDNSGAAYVYRRRPSGLWGLEAYLKASNAEGSDRFGAAVGISGSTIAVSATGEASLAIGVGGNQFDNSGSDVCAVYAFDFANGGWFQSSYVKASNSDDGDNFGAQLSISGDGLFVSTIFEQSTATGIDGDQSINTDTNVGAAYMIR